KTIAKLDPSHAPLRLSTGGIILNKIPAIIRPSMKRAAAVTAEQAERPEGHVSIDRPPNYQISKEITRQSVSELLPKGAKYVIQSQNAQESQNLGAAISSLPASTTIKATTRAPAAVAPATHLGTPSHPVSPLASYKGALQTSPTVSRVASVVRQAVFIKREAQPQRTMRNMTLTNVESSPLLHLGVEREHMPLLKRHVCRSANITHLDCFITLRKLRQNEPFALLAEHFELSEPDAEDTFKRTLIKLARCLRPLIRWPDRKHYQERLKHTPIDYRANLLHVRSLMECVETDVDEEFRLGSASYKFILCINTNGIISYVSGAYPGNCDDLQLFEASNFQDMMPKYLTLCAEPGKAVPRSRPAEEDSADEADIPDMSRRSVSKFQAQRMSAQLASQHSLSVLEGALVSKRATSVQLPTMRVREPVCREQIRSTIDGLREYRMLGHSAIYQQSLLGYLDEMIVVAAALSNLKRQEHS
ncbi:hypothetical protein KR018_009939, partial [Drosophila ironensis]